MEQKQKKSRKEKGERRFEREDKSNVIIKKLAVEELVNTKGIYLNNFDTINVN